MVEALLCFCFLLLLFTSFCFHFFLFFYFLFLFLFFYKNTSCTDLLMHVLLRSSGWVDMCLDLDTPIWLLFSTDCVKTADKIPLWQLRSRRLCIAFWRTSGIYLIIICGLIFLFPVLQQSAVCFYYTGHSKPAYELITCTKHDHFNWRYYMELLSLVLKRQAKICKSLNIHLPRRNSL